jgi:hypothetical protein
MDLVEQKKKLFNDLLNAHCEDHKYNPNNPTQITIDNVIANAAKATFDFSLGSAKGSPLIQSRRYIPSLIIDGIITPPEGKGLMAVNFMSLKQTGPFNGSNHASNLFFVNGKDRLFTFRIEAERHKQDGKNKFACVANPSASEESIILPINSCGVARKDLQPENFLVTAKHMVSIIIASAFIAKQFNEDSKLYNLKNNNCNTAAQSIIEGGITQLPADWNLAQAVIYTVGTGAVGLGLGIPYELTKEQYQGFGRLSDTSLETLQPFLEGYIPPIINRRVMGGNPVPMSAVTDLKSYTKGQEDYKELYELICNKYRYF